MEEVQQETKKVERNSNKFAQYCCLYGLQIYDRPQKLSRRWPLQNWIDYIKDPEPVLIQWIIHLYCKFGKEYMYCKLRKEDVSNNTEQYRAVHQPTSRLICR